MIKLSTKLIEVPSTSIANLSVSQKSKLASAIAAFVEKSDPTQVTVDDLLTYYPIRYEDRSNLARIDELAEGIEAAVEVHVKVSGGFRVGKNRDPRKPPLYVFEISGTDASRTQRPVVVKWFVSGKAAERIISFYQERFNRGTRFVAFGEWEWDARRNTYSLLVNKPEELEILDESAAADQTKLIKEHPETAEENGREFVAVHNARRVPIYRKLGDFQTKRLREIIYGVLTNLDPDSVVDNLPTELTERQNLIGALQALTEIHFPPENSSISDYEMHRSPAHRRLIFEEFFWLSFAMQLLRGERQKEPKGTVIEIGGAVSQRLKDFVPFALTSAQERVVTEILDDLKSDAPMNRLIQGDVGSGKTIVAFLTALAVLENGYQAALMSPTEILAEQHFRNATVLFQESGYRVALLTGSTKASEKRKLRAGLEAGEIDFIIGTHALIQDAVAFRRLGLAIIDEQHRFGVMQRAQLKSAGSSPDVLVMTATPIPRSLAMTVYGDLDVSIIDELPPGRTPIKSVVLGEDQRSGVYRGIEREIKRGRQVYVVYPLIEESAKMDLKAATIMYEDLRTRIFPQYRIGLLHGQMKAADKDEIMGEFVKGKLDIMVSTTVIEVGVDVPNASLMVIEHAERFGLSQLHQLRGRVGRGAEQSFCVLLTDFKKTAVAKERLGIMEKTSDGFKIAEKDLEIRGQGEILGTRQSGIQNFRLGNIVRDFEILAAARDEARHYLTDKRLSPETSAMVRISRADRKMRFASVG